MIPDLTNGALPSPHRPPQSPHASIVTMPVQKHARSHSSSDFPPPMRRVSSENSGVSRPVPFARKFTRVHPATTGVTVLEHMERLDEVEAGLKRIGVEDEALAEDDEEEVDVGEMASSVPRRLSGSDTEHSAAAAADRMSPPPQSERLSVVPEDDLDAEEDLVAMSKSLPALEVSPGARHGRWPSMGGPAPERPSLDWIDSAESPRPRTVIVEVRVPACL